MARLSKAISSVTGVVIALGGVGCGLEAEVSTAGLPGDKEDSFGASAGSCLDAWEARDHEARLAVDVYYDDELHFCPDEPGLSLENATTLAFLAANEYAHFGYMAPMLDYLGFGEARFWQTETGVMNSAEAWTECTESLYYLRCAEAEGSLPEDPEEWPFECARQYAAEREGTGAGIAAGFERWLVTTAHPDWNVQFISGGSFELDGRVFEQGTTQLLWLEHPTLPLVVISFRGTSPDASDSWWDRFRDIWVDLSFWQEAFELPAEDGWQSYPSLGEVHAGFNQAFRTVYGDILEERLDRLAEERPEAAVWVTGHSLGGALATLTTTAIMTRMAFDSRWEGLNLRGVVTFGSPRVGNFDFSDAFEALAAPGGATEEGITALRFVHGRDLVPTIPKSIWLPGEEGEPSGGDYRHVGQPIYLGAAGDSHCPAFDLCQASENEGEEAICSTADSCILEDHVVDEWRLFGSVEDHGMVHYYERLVDLMYDPYSDAQGYLGCGSW